MLRLLVAARLFLAAARRAPPLLPTGLAAADEGSASLTIQRVARGRRARRETGRQLLECAPPRRRSNPALAYTARPLRPPPTHSPLLL